MPSQGSFEMVRQEESLAMEVDIPRKEDTDRGISSQEEERNTCSACGEKLMEEQDNICAEMYSMLSKTKHLQKKKIQQLEASPRVL